MGTLKAHAISEKELQKFNILVSSDHISIAEYFRKELENPLLAFEHSHEEYEFVIPIMTIPLFKYEKAAYMGEVGYCYPINSYTNHGLEFDLDTCALISIAAEKAWVEELKEKLGFKGQSFFTHFILRKEIMDEIRMFEEEGIKAKPDSKLMNELAEEIISSFIKDGLTLGLDNRKPEKVYAKNIKKVIRFMYENFINPDLTIADLAALSGYSLSYFSRSFKAYMNEPPIVHLNKLRLSEAKRLFKDKELTLAKIAFRVGYRNLSTFTEAFKNINNCKPKKYRDKYS